MNEFIYELIQRWCLFRTGFWLKPILRNFSINEYQKIRQWKLIWRTCDINVPSHRGWYPDVFWCRLNWSVPSVIEVTVGQFDHEAEPCDLWCISALCVFIFSLLSVQHSSNTPLRLLILSLSVPKLCLLSHDFSLLKTLEANGFSSFGYLCQCCTPEYSAWVMIQVSKDDVLYFQIKFSL